MMADFHIWPVTALHPEMQALQEEAQAEEFGFVGRLVREWVSGENRFDRPGEMFLGDFQGGRLLAFCGLNQDPYVARGGVARLRHLYVRRDARRAGLATALTIHILKKASAAFHQVRLRTDRREAAAFYARLGFEEVDDATASHVFALPYRAPL